MNKEYLYRGGRLLAPIRGKAPLPGVFTKVGNHVAAAESRHAIIVAGVFPLIAGVKYEIGQPEGEDAKKEVCFVRTESLDLNGEKFTAFIADSALNHAKTA